MDTRARKVLGDLLLRKPRTALTLVGLVISFWGLGTVLVGYRILAHDLSANYTRTNPPHLEIDAAGVTPRHLSRITAIENVTDVENRPRIGGRIAIGPDRWMPLVLFVAEDFRDLDVARFFPEIGTLPPPTGEILIERDALPLIRFWRAASNSAGHGRPQGQAARAPKQAMDRWSIRLPGGVEVKADLAGTVYDPGQAPARMEMLVYGYVSRATAQDWMPDGFDNRLLVRTAHGLDDPDQREALIAAVRNALEGAEVSALRILPTDEHPHQFQMNTILFVLLALGILGFLLSGVLVVNLVSTLLTNQIRQIGSLKAMGATTGQVALLYLVGMALLGLVAAAIALPAAVQSGFSLARVMASMLNFEVLTRVLPGYFMAALVTGGAVFPVAVAWLPVRRWSSVPVRAALDNYGLSARERLDTRIARLPLPLTGQLGLRNAVRNPRRLALGAATLAVGTLVFLIAMNLRASLLHTAERQTEATRYDVSVTFRDTVSRDRIAWISRLPWTERLELWDVGHLETETRPREGSNGFTIVAVLADTQAIRPHLLRGQWPATGDTDTVVANQRFMALYPGLEVGDTMAVALDGQRRSITITGVIKEFGGARLYMDAAGYRALSGTQPGRGRLALVTLEADADISLYEFTALLENHFDMLRLEVAQLQVSRIASRVIDNHLGMIEVILGILALLMLVVSALGLASGIATSVVERTREIGVLRTIGATPRAVRAILAAEALCIALGAWLAAVLVAWPLSAWITGWFGAGIVEYPFDYATSLPGIGLSLAVVIILALLATYGPARGVSRQAIHEAVSYE